MAALREMLRGSYRILAAAGNPFVARPGAVSSVLTTLRYQSSQSTSFQPTYVPETSLSRPPWPEIKLPDSAEEAKHHAVVIQKVNNLIAAGHYGRLFAVVHFACRQWKVTNEDLILIENHLSAECGDRIRLEKVLLVGGDDFTLIGKPLLGRDLVRVEATIIEKTESWPKISMTFWKRHRFQRKKVTIRPQTVLRINTIEVAPCLL
ncbi:39S ribosomal protein L21, mitochondrial [Latimeria chalumnae]|uniref:Large ribosomal subunit protein bL21m n=1 Tax=Latimeria chalumnae TaxID=7897 RepID=H3BHL5_LATCH|nr:PREDICTED: 39S ribosomal protein L21, mitochondrial [Latimeria chalumnae]|eukprot:XP_005988079.1 PREDICTED: 39S ribosomal protein L21, mitochondrial [Latimeria chalumnae]